MLQPEQNRARPPAAAFSGSNPRPQVMQWARWVLGVGAVSRAIRSCFKVSSIVVMINCLDIRRSGDDMLAGLSWRRGSVGSDSFAIEQSRIGCLKNQLLCICFVERATQEARYVGIDFSDYFIVGRPKTVFV
jgi:hypothetical protein